MYWTSVWTIKFRCMRMSWTILSMLSSSPMSSACVTSLSMAMYVPVRPTPALQWIKMGTAGLVTDDRTAFRKPSSSCVVSGTP